MPISLINKKDHFVWPYRNDGQYSVRSRYQAAKEEKDTREEAMLSKASTIQNLKEITAEYLIATKDLNRDNKVIAGRNGESRRITWRPPPRNKVKVNIDAAFDRETGIAASAAVIRDWQGKIITGISSKFKTTSIRNCIIESDCLPLVQAIKARTPLAEADTIIRDILQMLEEASDEGATWTPREGNILAHQLAAMAAENQLQRQWTVTPPVQVRNIIRTEVGFTNL
ncbi:hypothetical protein Ahy_Scaffold1g107105 isoform A [Arachis hypogaea]|uniref:RNase H type-1 domain-containing protein n=1 Tax=Arachis hypogaea TaxID=3818 RepID=A0A444WUQ1_ARAHY|nr:hypothetical protein Ahy_Scaffold1g107105 isoform A [Arachis hypogaea]